MLENLFTGHEIEFVVNLIICLMAGLLIGAEREMRGKAAGISTQFFIIAGAMSFTFISILIEPGAQGRVAAEIVTGIGFLGAGIILKSKGGIIKNLTTAASIWMSAAIGMLIGFQLYLIAVVAVIFSVCVPSIPKIRRRKKYIK